MSRKLRIDDMLAAVRMLDAIDAKKALESVVREGVEKKQNNKVLGLNMLWAVILQASKVGKGKALYEFLGNLLGMEPDAVAELGAVELFDTLLEVANPQEWADFFERVQKIAMSR